jgi:hypothetical protein
VEDQHPEKELQTKKIPQNIKLIEELKIPKRQSHTINEQHNRKAKVHINKIETQPITGNRQRENYKSKIFPSDVKANPRLVHISMKISSTIQNKSKNEHHSPT